MDELLIAKVSI